MTLTKGNIKKRINSLLHELQEKTGVTDEEIINLKKILDLTNYPEKND